jgi:hypothetical protein
MGYLKQLNVSQYNTGYIVAGSGFIMCGAAGLIYGYTDWYIAWYELFKDAFDNNTGYFIVGTFLLSIGSIFLLSYYDYDLKKALTWQPVTNDTQPPPNDGGSCKNNNVDGGEYDEPQEGEYDVEYYSDEVDEAETEEMSEGETEVVPLETTHLEEGEVVELEGEETQSDAEYHGYPLKPPLRTRRSPERYGFSH